MALGGPPTVVAPGGSAQDTGRSTAVLHADVNPNEAATTYYFEYGQRTDYGAQTSATELPSSAGAVTPLPASAVATELVPGTLYHFRVIATNATGTTVGPDVTFTSGAPTPPAVQTDDATDIAPSGAAIAGIVTTRGLITIYGFRVGTSPDDLGPITGMGSVGAGFSEATVRLRLTGLQSDTAYYYTVVGESTDGQTEGETRSFTTSSYPNPNITVTQTPLLSGPLVQWPTGSRANTATPAARVKVNKKLKGGHKHRRRKKK
jgi:phosphodiesterase/alkaline phosphatase D-like protein